MKATDKLTVEEAVAALKAVGWAWPDGTDLTVSRIPAIGPETADRVVVYEVGNPDLCFRLSVLGPQVWVERWLAVHDETGVVHDVMAGTRLALRA